MKKFFNITWLILKFILSKLTMKSLLLVWMIVHALESLVTRITTGEWNPIYSFLWFFATCTLVIAEAIEKRKK